MWYEYLPVSISCLVGEVYQLSREFEIYRISLQYREESEMILLKAIDKNNWEECIQLKPSSNQERFIVSNLYSIAEAQFLEGFKTKAIYHGGIMIGFTMFGLDPDDGNYWIYRFMIDERFQRRGYGHQAMQLVIDEIRNASDRTSILILGYKPDNEQARRLYAKTGFKEEGIAPWGEMLAKYTYS
ncbi:Spermine/spermidine acetyltransferase [compost metagenome]